MPEELVTYTEIKGYDIINDFTDWWEQNKKHLLALFVIPIILTLFLFMFLALLLGVVYGNGGRYSNLEIACVNLDHGQVGTSLLNFCGAFPQASNVPRMVIRNFSSFPEVLDSLDKGENWGYIVVNANTSTNFMNEVGRILSGVPNDGTYDASKAISIVYDGGRATLSGVIINFMTTAVDQ
eukprot:TRINITY_DN17225_c0_g2_i1.p2 TRINITY_DN17225_c0_g2~~TRINITY_DN17225_c0_g2_i1.p2  ORF type:complete len:200 (-),score=35.56 TRINITY_DN17225_c0_g2_i1:762-1304(-)